MRIRLPILFGALLALSISTTAGAEEPTADAFDPNALRLMSDVSLDSAFEQATQPANDLTLTVLGVPTTMRCDDKMQLENPETCVVTADGRVASAPAALAQP